MLYQALEEKNYKYIQQQVGFYMENAKMYGFPSIEVFAKNIHANILEEQFENIFNNLSKLDIVIKDYISQF